MKKRLICAALAAAIIGLSACGAGAEPTPPPATPEPTPPPTPTPTPVAEEIQGLSVSANGAAWETLTDGDRTTKCWFDYGTVMTVTAPEDICALYIIWDQPPGEYEISCGGQTLAAGADGFLHEWIPLPSPSAELDVGLTAAGAVPCDIRAYGFGEAPEDVQVWQPPCQSADILVLPTHSDDDPIFFGALIAYYGGYLGLEVQVAYMCQHWNDPPRPHETLDGLWEMGIRNYPVMGRFEDKFAVSLWDGFNKFDSEAVVGWQVEMIRRFKPSVVIDHDQGGEYGHGAHCVNAWGVLKAVEYAPDSSKYPASAQTYGVWDVPKLYLHLEQEGEISKLVLDKINDPLEAFGGRSAFEVSEDAMQLHESQLQYSHRPRQGQDNEYPEYDCTLYALMYSTVGPDEECNDIMEHLSPKI